MANHIKVVPIRHSELHMIRENLCYFHLVSLREQANNRSTRTPTLPIPCDRAGCESPAVCTVEARHG